jgi:hypothetical protein
VRQVRVDRGVGALAVEHGALCEWGSSGEGEERDGGGASEFSTGGGAKSWFSFGLNFPRLSHARAARCGPGNGAETRRCGCRAYDAPQCGAGGRGNAPSMAAAAALAVGREEGRRGLLCVSVSLSFARRARFVVSQGREEVGRSRVR